MSYGDLLSIVGRYLHETIEVEEEVSYWTEAKDGKAAADIDDEFLHVQPGEQKSGSRKEVEQKGGVLSKSVTRMMSSLAGESATRMIQGKKVVKKTVPRAKTVQQEEKLQMNQRNVALASCYHMSYDTLQMAEDLFNAVAEKGKRREWAKKNFVFLDFVFGDPAMNGGIIFFP